MPEENNKKYCNICKKYVIPSTRGIIIDEDEGICEEICPECDEILNECSF